MFEACSLICWQTDAPINTKLFIDIGAGQVEILGDNMLRMYNQIQCTIGTNYYTLECMIKKWSALMIDLCSVDTE